MERTATYSIASSAKSLTGTISKRAFWLKKILFSASLRECEGDKEKSVGAHVLTKNRMYYLFGCKTQIVELKRLAFSIINRVRSGWGRHGERF